MEDIAATGIGYTPTGLSNGLDYGALLPDYSLAGLPDVAAYILSAIIGVALLVIVFKLIATLASRGKGKVPATQG